MMGAHWNFCPECKEWVGDPLLPARGWCYVCEEYKRSHDHSGPWARVIDLQAERYIRRGVMR